MFNSNGYSLADVAAATGGNRNNDGFGDNGAWWIIILFIFAFAGWGNGGFGGGNGGGSTTREEIAWGFDINGLDNSVRGVQQGLCDGFYAMNSNFGNLQTTLCQGFSGVNDAVRDSRYDVTQAIQQGTIAGMQNTNAITAQLAQMSADNQLCCCENKAQIADLNYNFAREICDVKTLMQNNTRDLIENQNQGVREILNFLTQDKIATLQAENQELKAERINTQQNQFITQVGNDIVRTLMPSPIPAYTVPNPNAVNYNCGCGGCGCGLNGNYLG